MGDWMKVNGDALYGTRITGPFQEDRTFITRKGNRTYVIYLAEGNQATPPAEITVSCIKSGSFVRMLGVSKAIKWEIGQNGLTINIPEDIRQSLPCEHVWAFEVAETEN